MTIKARFDGKAFVPDDPVDLPIGTAVQVYVLDTTPHRQMSIEELERFLAEMDEDAVECDHFVDWSRESIYGGTLDEPR